MQGVELDPLNPLVQMLHGSQLCAIDDFQGCVRVIEAAMASTPGIGFVQNVLVWTYHNLGAGTKLRVPDSCSD